jgi:hypothetical protein
MAFVAHRGTNLVLVSYVNKPGYIASGSHSNINLEPAFFLCRISGLRGQCLSNGFFTLRSVGFSDVSEYCVAWRQIFFLPVTWHPPEPDSPTLKEERVPFTETSESNPLLHFFFNILLTVHLNRFIY